MNRTNTLTRLKAKEREHRQSLIIDAAREVFGQKTYDKASMAEIAKTAGIAKSSIYTYFNSQEELYAKIVYMDSCVFLEDLEARIDQAQKDPGSKECLNICITGFLSYYIDHAAQWRMITHFALHGNKEMGAMGQLNEIGRRLMDLFESVLRKLGCEKESRILAHTLFSSLSGILIAFRNYPGRTEAERMAHMKRIGTMVESMVLAMVKKKEFPPRK